MSSPSGNLAYGTISRFTITAVDKGSPALTGTTYVDVIYRETTTTTTTTTAAPSTYNFWDDSGAVAAFSIAIVLGQRCDKNRLTALFVNCTKNIYLTQLTTH